MAVIDGWPKNVADASSVRITAAYVAAVASAMSNIHRRAELPGVFRRHAGRSDVPIGLTPTGGFVIGAWAAGSYLCHWPQASSRSDPCTVVPD
jgi:hypothetical protein